MERGGPKCTFGECGAMVHFAFGSMHPTAGSENINARGKSDGRRQVCRGRSVAA